MKIVASGSIVDHTETGPNYFINISETVHLRLSKCFISTYKPPSNKSNIRLRILKGSSSQISRNLKYSAKGLLFCSFLVK